MLTNQQFPRSSRLGLLVGFAGVTVGIATGFAVGASPLFLGLGLGVILAIAYFCASFQQAVIGLLIVRSLLDPFSQQQIPAAFAIALDVLTLAYVVVRWLIGQQVKCDRFWWFLSGWVMLQGLWVILLPLGGLGLGTSVMLDSIREWIRLFSWLMVYLLVMQLEGRISAKKVISWLFFALLMPMTVALAQTVAPSVLPSILLRGSDPAASALEQTSRINGTLGHPNTFATFVLLFIGLTIWKLGQVERRWPWLLLLGLLAFFYVSTKALFSLMMLAVFVLVLIAPRLSLINLIGGVTLFAIVIALFGSTEFGQERLGSIANTPLLNPDMDISRAILLSKGDGNSFNWRIAQWTYLLEQWQQYPFLGFGLGLSKYVAANKLYPHNDYVRALVEGGIVGFGTFIVFLVATVARLVSLLRNPVLIEAQRSLCLSLLAVFLAIPVAMITENIWSHTTFFFYWWTLFAVAGWNWNEVEPVQKTRNANIQFFTPPTPLCASA
jgi:O-antigen ligase